MKTTLGNLKRIIKEAMMSTRTDRSGYTHAWAKKWGWTHLPWPEFVARFPEEAAAFGENYTEGWDDEEIDAAGGPDVTTWQNLYDDEAYVDSKGRPVINANLTGPGGSLMMGYDGDGWDEILVDDNGYREGDEEYVER